MGITHGRTTFIRSLKRLLGSPVNPGSSRRQRQGR
jgi:hypothetical protein